MTTATGNSHNAQQSTSMIKIRHYRVHEDKKAIRSDEIKDLESKMKNVKFMTHSLLILSSLSSKPDPLLSPHLSSFSFRFLRLWHLNLALFGTHHVMGSLLRL
jgi:hypothetical protein